MHQVSRSYNTTLISIVMGMPITGFLRNTYLTVNLKDYYTTLKTNKLTFTGKNNILSKSKNLFKNLSLLKVGDSSVTQAKNQGKKKTKTVIIPMKGSQPAKNWANNQVESKKINLYSSYITDKQSSLSIYPQYKRWVKHLTYSQVGKILLNSKLNNGYWVGTITNWNLKTINFWSLYSSKTKVITALMVLFAPKITQMLASRSSFVSNYVTSKSPNLHGAHSNFYPEEPCDKNFLNLNTNNDNFIEQNNSLKMATDLLRVFLHKRFLYKQNLIVSKLFNFTNKTVLKEPPSPPLSSLGIPAKRFENYKRVIHENLVLNKKGFLTSSYNQRHLSGKMFNNKLEITPEEGISSIPLIGIVKYYQNKLLKRHAQYLTNQWWNGQLSEHNTETVFLSDIDWRSTYIKKDFQKRTITFTKRPLKTKLEALESKLEDILLDFPDSDQYYNPRNRRWLVNKGIWSFWFDLDKVYSEEIIKTMLVESITQTQLYLYNNTELLDFISSAILKAGFTHSIGHNFNTQREKTNNAGSASTQYFGSNQHPITEVNELLITNILNRWVV